MDALEKLFDEDETDPIVQDEPVEEPTEQEADGQEEFIVQIGDDEPEESSAAPDWVKDLRKANREKEKRIKELEAQLQAPVKMEKPKREDFDYDEDAYDEALLKWSASQRENEERQRREQEQAEASQQAFQARLKAYEDAKVSLKVPDYDEAEAFILEAFSEVQQGIAIQGADNPAVLVYALGKNPKKAKELAAITDPVQFAFALAKLETQVKTTKRTPLVAPEGVVRSDATSKGVRDNLARLQREADQTGDRTRLIQFKKKHGIS